MKNPGFTIPEVLISMVILSFLVISIIGASVFVKNICDASIVSHNLQRDVNSIIQQIAHRDIKENSYAGLLSSTGQITDPANPLDLVFNELDGKPRGYRVVNNTLIYIVYASPTILVPEKTRIVYTSPPGGSIKLGYTSTGNYVTVDLVLTQPFAGRTIAGSARITIPLNNV